MDESTKFYMTPNTMEPLFPDDDIKKLENLSLELIRKSSKLEGTMNPITRKAIADFLRPMNSYYSNLIEAQYNKSLKTSQSPPPSITNTF